MGSESRANRIELHMTVSSEAQARELDAAWREIVTEQKMPRSQTLEQDTSAITDRAQEGLAAIEKAIRTNPTTNQARRLVHFLAAIYNGHDFSFDLTDLRTLNTELANACLDYLNYDRLCKREVQSHLSGSDRQLHRWIKDYRVPPRLILDDEQADALEVLGEETDRSPNELLREAIGLLLAKKRPVR